MLASDFDIRASNVTRNFGFVSDFGFRNSGFEFSAFHQHEERLETHFRVRPVAEAARSSRKDAKNAKMDSILSNEQITLREVRMNSLLACFAAWREWACPG